MFNHVWYLSLRARSLYQRIRMSAREDRANMFVRRCLRARRLRTLATKIEELRLTTAHMVAHMQFEEVPVFLRRPEVIQTAKAFMEILVNMAIGFALVSRPEDIQLHTRQILSAYMLVGFPQHALQTIGPMEQELITLGTTMLDSLEAVRASVLSRPIPFIMDASFLRLVKSFVLAMFAYIPRFAEWHGMDFPRMVMRVQNTLRVVLVANLMEPDPEREDQIERLSGILARHAGQQAVEEAKQTARAVAIQHMGEMIIPVIQQQWVTPTFELAEQVARMSAALVRVGGPEALENLINSIEPPGVPADAAFRDEA